MMSELEQVTEMKNAIEIKTNEMKNIKDPATEISMTDYLKICTEMNDKAKALGVDGGMGASATKAPKASRQPAPSSDGKKDKLMNAPPPGKYAKKHVEEWKNHKTQRTANGACSYCGTQGHDAKICYHLDRENRPPNWKPKPGLWYWKFHDNKIFNENKDQQLAGKPTEKTRQANFDAVASSATSSEPAREYNFGGMAIAETEMDLIQYERPVSDQGTDSIQQDIFCGEIGLAGSAVSMPSRQLRTGVDWVLDSGSSWHICSNRDLFISYKAYRSDEGPGWDSSAGQRAKAEGAGDIILPIRRPDGSRYELQVQCLYKPGNRFNLLSLLAIRQQKGIRWNPDDMIIRDENRAEIGYTFVGMNVPFIELADEPNPVIYKNQMTNQALTHQTSVQNQQFGPQQQANGAISYALISAELAHRRLGHAGSYKGRINKDKLGEDVDTKECFDCEPCHKAKSKKIVSREKQARATKVGQLVHVDLHPCKPKGLSKMGKQDREHAMIITDDASRFRTTICIAKKALFKTARQAAKDLGSTDTGQHVSSGEEHRFVEEEASFNSDDAEMFYNTETVQDTLENRVQALRDRRETPDRQIQQFSPPQSI
ncbi:hypothetical protein N7534_007605 [Penicillium rubens]|nr:hypothetical protein N7534_007605 [Penicillium rubens]